MMKGIFIATFLNTAILLLIMNANTQYTVLYWIPLHRGYTDMNEDWYLAMGPTIIETMCINAVYPYIGFFMYIVMKGL